MRKRIRKALTFLIVGLLVIVGAGLLTGLGEDEIFDAVKEEMLK